MTCRITYNSKNLDFPFDIYRLQFDYPGSRLLSESPASIAETLNVGPDIVINLAFRLLVNATSTHATLKRNLYQWFEWARQGYSWTFARDSSKVSSTTLSSGASAGASSLTVASISGISNGDQLILRSDTDIELVKVNGAPSGSTINLTENLNFAFASSSRVRHEQYWSARLVDVRRHPVLERPPLHFDVELVFMEDWS